MEWTKTRPTQPGFYFMRDSGGRPLVVSVSGEKIYDGPFQLVDMDLLQLEFAGPIPLPEQHEAKSCYDCAFCEDAGELPRKAESTFVHLSRGGSEDPERGHCCMAPVPAWAQGERNEEIPIIEDAAHDAIMAEHCELFRRRG